MSEGFIRFRATSEEWTEKAGTTPVLPVRMGSSGLGLIVNDHREAVRILSDVAAYGSAGELIEDAFGSSTSPSPDAMCGRVFAVNQTDGDEHRQVRRALRKVIDHRVRRVSDGLLQDIQRTIDHALRGGQFDAVAAIGAPIADKAISRLLGLDHNLITALRTAAYQGDPVHEIDATLVDLVRERRAHPTDDLVSDLVAQMPSLGDRHVAANTRLLAMSNVEVLSALFSNGVLCLAQDLNMQDLVRADETLLSGFVQEVLRFASPVARGIYRVTKAPSTIGRYTVPAGTLIVIGVDVCNRDSAALPNAEDFDPKRGHEFGHLTFGHGRHSCLGIRYTRMIAENAFRAILAGTTRFGLTVDTSELRWHSTGVMNGLIELPVWFEHAKSPASKES